MDSTSERKRSFETASQDKLQTGDRLSKKPRLSEQDFQPNQNAFETSSQPTGFRPASEPRHAGFISFSAPPNRSDSLDSATPLHDPRLPSKTTPLTSQPFCFFESFEPTHQPSLSGSQESIDLSSLISPPQPITSEPALGRNLTNKQNLECSPELPPSSIFAVKETNQVDEAAGGTSILDNSPTSENVDAPNILVQHGEAEIDVSHGATSDSPAYQAVLAPHEPGRIDREAASITPKVAPQFPLQAIRQGEGLTPLKLSSPSSPPPVMPPSSPFGSPAKSTSEAQNPFAHSYSQEGLASFNDAPGNMEPQPVKVPPEHADVAKSIPSEEPEPRAKKENIHPHQDSGSLPPKAQPFTPDLKSHEASSNLSKASPNHPTVSSQNRSAKKIRTPFRSPLVNKTLAANQLPSAGGSQATKDSLVTALRPVTVAPEPKKRGALSRIKGAGTTAARAAFKSPLHSGANATGADSSVSKASSPAHKATAAGFPRNDPRQARLQLLRRAIKIKESGEDEKLEELVGKWKEVAKEVAWELWGLVKEGNVTESRGDAGLAAAGFGGFGGKDRGWAGGALGAGAGGGGQQNWGWDTAESEGEPWEESAVVTGEEADNEDEEDPKVEERTMGSMLCQLGIAQETLGWDEEEGDFKDITP